MKKSNVRQVIRKIVREEVAMAINEVITELKQPTRQVSQPKPKKKIIEKKDYSKNSILNEVMNETAASEEWKTMGGGKFDSSRMNELVGGYGDMMNNNQPSVNSNDPMSQFVSKDYRAVLKKAEEKDKQKHGKG